MMIAAIPRAIRTSPGSARCGPHSDPRLVTATIPPDALETGAECIPLGLLLFLGSRHPGALDSTHAEVWFALIYFLVSLPASGVALPWPATPAGARIAAAGPTRRLRTAGRTRPDAGARGRAAGHDGRA